MRKSIMLKVGAVGTTFAMAGALAIAASGTTGAYFSQTKDGNVSGTFGSVTLTTSDTMFTWTNMMPGEAKTATVGFTNTGSGPQDFYIVFPNVPALHALNNLGTYGEVHVAGGEITNVVPLFDSMNLQDGRHPNTSGNLNSCGNVFAQANPPKAGCWPLPPKLRIAANVAANATGSVSFTFNYAGILGDGTPGPSVGVGVFNSFPLTNTTKDVYAGSPDAAGPAGDGLPFQIVAVQVGQQP